MRLVSFATYLVVGLAGAVAVGVETEEPVAAGSGDSATGLNRSLQDPEVRGIRQRLRDDRRTEPHAPMNEIPEIAGDLAKQRERLEAAEARRQTPAAKAERERSRVAHADLPRDRAIGLARREFPQLFSAADRRALPLRTGQRVLRYSGDRTAVVRGTASANGASVVDSSLPLRARDDSGRLAPVDLDLERTGSGWAPATAAVPVALGDSADAALSFPGEFTLGLGDASNAGSRTSNEIFFKDVLPDTDAWWGPTDLGARVGIQLRSEDAPEELRLTLRDAPGVQLGLRAHPGGHAVELRRDGAVIGTMSAPIAFDADDQPVDVKVRVEGAQIVIEVPHRDHDLLYPLAVDPVFENQDSWKYGANTNNAGWQYQSIGGACSPSYMNWWLGTGFYIFKTTDRWYNIGDFCEYMYWSPTPYSYIHRADFIHVSHSGSPSSTQTSTTQGMFSTTQWRHVHWYTQGYSFDAANQYWSVCADGVAADWACDEWVDVELSRGNYVQSNIASTANRFPAANSVVYLGGARIWMSDQNLPDLWYWMDAPSGWVRDTPAGPYNGVNEAHVRIGDAGLGMWGLWMDVPGKARQFSSSWGGCSGARSSPCPDSRAHNFSYAGMSEGVQTVTVTGQDVLGKTRSFQKTLKIDRTAPTIEAEGPLRPTDTQWVEGGEQGISIDASDALSGVTTLELKIDGQVAQTATQGCSSGCDMSRDFIVDTAGLAEGQHQVAAVARDGAGNATTTQWSIRVERTPPALALSGSLKAAEGQTLQDGVTYSLVASATDNVGPIAQSGVRSIAMRVDDNDAIVASQACALGGCSMTKTFDYRPEDHESGPRQINVTATDFAGNSTTQTFTVTNRDPAAVTCPATPSPTVVQKANQVTPAAAQTQLESSQGFPPALAPNTTVTLDGRVIQPRLDGSNSAKFSATGLVLEFAAQADRQASDGVTTTVDDGTAPLCVSPTTVSNGASQPSGPINGTAALYANSHPATDTVIRATAVGLKSFYQLRTSKAPIDLSWRVGLQAGQQLRLLSNGSAAIVEPAPVGAPPPSVSAPAEPTLAQRRQAVTDTDLHMRLANTDLLRAQALTADRVVAVVPKPWAQDSQQRAVPASLSVVGSTLSMRVDHTLAGTTYPVIADPEVVTADAVDEAEAARASDDTAQYTDAELDAFQPAAGTAPPPPPSSSPTAGEQDDPFNEPLDGSAFTHDGTEDLTGGNPQASAAIATLNGTSRTKLQSLDIGLTESDPATLDSSHFTSLNPTRLRPLVPYNVVALLNSPDPDLRRRARMWDDWARRARARGRKVDIAITRDLDTEKGGRPPTIAEYRAGLSAFLAPDRYGPVVQNLSAWNEPNFRRDPLRSSPRLAARYWIHARQLCHPRNLPKRCGYVIAGEYAGIVASKERRVTYAGKRWLYTTLYHRYLRNREKKPSIWAFHAYDDTEAFALYGDKTPSLMDRYHRLFSQTNYQTKDDPPVSPRIWLSAIGSPYTYGCAGLREQRQRDFCGGTTESRQRVLFLGMRKQRDTLAFILGQIATKYRGITRLYYHPMHNTRGIEYPDIGPDQHSGRCARPPQVDNPNTPENELVGPYCARDDWGLVGADHDGTIQYWATLPGASGRSSPGQRRLAFCLLRERRPEWVSRPGRLKTCS